MLPLYGVHWRSAGSDAHGVEADVHSVKTNSSQATGAGLDLTPVSIAAIRHLADFPCDLYFKDRSSGLPVLYRSRKLSLAAKALSEARVEGEPWLYASTADLLRCRQALEEQLPHLLERDDIPAADRLALVVTAVDPTLRRGFYRVTTERVVEESARIGRQVARVLNRGDVVAAEVFAILRHDQYTFTHVVNVSSYAVILAERMGIRDPKDLEEIAIAGLLHDVGKRFIPVRILNKRGRLDARERQAIQTHPLTGYQELVRVGGATHAQLMITYQHHERPDGRGYPVGITQNEIHPLARLCSVVDVFDALTGQRPYRSALSLAEALVLMQQQSGRQFDTEMLQCWQSAMQTS